MINKEVRVHHILPIHILSVIRKIGSQGGSLVGSTFRHNGQIFIFVKNDSVLANEQLIEWLAGILYVFWMKVRIRPL